MSNDDDFAALFEASQPAPANGASKNAKAERLKPGQRVNGVVVAISDDTIFIDLGTRIEGQLSRFDLTNDKGELKVAVGDRVKAIVAEVPARGAPVLRTAFGKGDIGTAELETAMESGVPVEGEFSKAVKAGLEVDIAGKRGFCPASQVDIVYVEDLEVFVGQKYFFRILEIKDGGRSIVVSRKALLLAEREEKAKELLARIEVGAELEGIVNSLTPYGAFIELGGLQGLVHVSEIAHSRISSPSDVLSVGESVRVKILSVETQADGKPPRLSLSMKALTQPTAEETAARQPRAKATEILSATVAKVDKQGVFVETESGAGLIPTNELDLPPGSDPRRHLQPGSTLDVVLLRREHSGRLRFSAKAVARVQEQQAFAAFTGKRKGGSKDSLGSLGELFGGIDLSKVK